MGLCQITTNYACFGVEVKNGVVVNSAPIAKWGIGKPWKTVCNWWTLHRKALIERVDDADNK